MPKTTCPRCGYPKASPNARGPNVIHCKRCGGLVPVDYRDEEGPYSDDPLRNAIGVESGHDTAGVCHDIDAIPRRGGLHSINVH